MKNWVLFVLFLLVACSVSTATPTQWEIVNGGNGHWYEAITDLVYWSNAKTLAENSSYLGQNGYLVTITSQEENDFVSSLIAGESHGFYLGATKTDFSVPATEGWSWITGEAWGYTNWHVADNANNDDAITIAGGSGGADFGEWEDLNGAIDPQYYIVEYVPEPASMVLLMLGGVAMVRQRKNC